MTLRYTIHYVGEHVAHLEAENNMIHEVPLEWLPIDIREGQLLLVEPNSEDSTSSPRFAILDGHA